MKNISSHLTFSKFWLPKIYIKCSFCFAFSIFFLKTNMVLKCHDCLKTHLSSCVHTMWNLCVSLFFLIWTEICHWPLKFSVSFVTTGPLKKKKDNMVHNFTIRGRKMPKESSDVLCLCVCVILKLQLMHICRVHIPSLPVKVWFPSNWHWGNKPHISYDTCKLSLVVFVKVLNDESTGCVFTLDEHLLLTACGTYIPIHTHKHTHTRTRFMTYIHFYQSCDYVVTWFATCLGGGVRYLKYIFNFQHIFAFSVEQNTLDLQRARTQKQNTDARQHICTN